MSKTRSKRISPYERKSKVLKIKYTQKQEIPVEIEYKKFDVIKYHKIHNDNILKTLKKNERIKIEPLEHNDSFYLNDFIKTRPAVILRVLTPNLYLIVPSTTRKAEKSFLSDFRTSINSLNNEEKESFLQWESILIVSKNQIDGFYMHKEKKSKNGDYKKIKLSKTAKKQLEEVFREKMNMILERNY